MNIVFWLLVIVVMVLVWFCMSSIKGIGGIGLKLFNDAKKEIEGDEPEKTKECEDDSSNER